MADKKGRGVSNLPVKIQDVPDAPTVSASNVGTSRAYNNGAATVTITPTTGGQPSSYSITTTPSTSTTTATSSPVTLTGLSSATSYTVSVTPSNASGVSGAATTSSSFTATTVPQAPTIGSPSVATGQSYTGSANVSVPFTPGATGGSAISSYTVLSSSGNSNTGASSPITVSDTVGVARTYTVTATNANGTSTASSASASTTPSSVPQAPTIGTATVSGTTASVTFTPGATGGSAITAYTATSSPGNITGTGASSPVSVSGLTAGTAYTFTVTATNANGISNASSASNSVTPQTYWLASIGSGGGNEEEGYCVAPDSSGNSFVGGWTQNGQSQVAYLAKFNSSGTVQWEAAGTSPYAGVASSWYNAVATDSSGNLYGTGRYANTSNGTNAFLVKYNTSGTVQWQRAISGTKAAASQGENGYGIATDSSGNVYVGGSTPGTTGTIAWLIKYNSSGTLQWQRKLTDAGSTPSTEIRGIAVDSSANVYVVGIAIDSSTTYRKAFLAKYNTSGTIQWQRFLGFSTQATYGYGISVDSSGNPYISGTALNGASFGSRGFIAKYNSSGTIQWQKLIVDTNNQGNGPDDSAMSMTTDSSNNAYVTINYVYNYSSGSRKHSAAIASWDSNGNSRWWLQTCDAAVVSGNQDSPVAAMGVGTDSYGSLYFSTGNNQVWCGKIPSDASKKGTYAIDGTYSFLINNNSTYSINISSNNDLTDSAGNMTDAAGPMTDGSGVVNFGATSKTLASVTI